MHTLPAKLVISCVVFSMHMYIFACYLLTILTYSMFIIWCDFIQTLSQAIVKVVIPTERYMFSFIITDLKYRQYPLLNLKKNSVEEKVVSWLSNGSFPVLLGDIWSLINFSTLCNFMSLSFVFIVSNVGNFIALADRMCLIDLIWSCWSNNTRLLWWEK